MTYKHDWTEYWDWIKENNYHKKALFVLLGCGVTAAGWVIWHLFLPVFYVLGFVAIPCGTFWFVRELMNEL